MGELNIFDTPEKTPMRGALARSLSAAACSSTQLVATVETLNPAKHFSEEGGMEGGAEGGVEGSKGAEGMDEAADDWAEEMADQSVGERPSTLTPTPTPVRWATSTPVPVTPTKGNKRMAVGTPAPKRGHRPMRLAPIGFAAALALEQILGAVVRVEKKMEEKVAALEARIVAGIGARAAEDEEREKRLAVRLLALNGIETELAQKGQWEIKQWTDLAAFLERRRVEIREIREAVAGLAQAAAAPERATAIFSPPSTRERAPPGPTVPGAPQLMEDVVVTPAQEIGGEGDNMEGVEREGLFASQHALALGESASAKQGGPGQEGIKKKKQKGKAKAVQIAEPQAPSRTPRGSAYQQRRQAALDAARLTGAASAVPWSILKCPETVEAEEKREKRRKAEAAKMEEEKAVARRRWEKWGKMTEAEQEAYSAAANSIKPMAYETETAGGPRNQPVGRPQGGDPGSGGVVGEKVGRGLGGPPATQPPGDGGSREEGGQEEKGRGGEEKSRGSKERGGEEGGEGGGKDEVGGRGAQPGGDGHL